MEKRYGIEYGGEAQPFFLLPDMPDRRKKLEHMEDESEVMASPLLSVKDRIKMG